MRWWLVRVVSGMSRPAGRVGKGLWCKAGLDASHRLVSRALLYIPEGFLDATISYADWIPGSLSSCSIPGFCTRGTLRRGNLPACYLYSSTHLLLLIRESPQLGHWSQVMCPERSHASEDSCGMAQGESLPYLQVLSPQESHHHLL